MSKSILVLGAAVVALAGCGSSSNTSSSTAASGAAAPTATTAPVQSAAGSGGGPLSIAADPSGQLKFDRTALSTDAGKVTIGFTNSASLAHNLTIASSSGATVGNTPTFSGGTKTLAVTLTAGTYTFFCAVPGHRQAGMQGTITVSAAGAAAGGGSTSGTSSSSSTTTTKSSPSRTGY